MPATPNAQLPPFTLIDQTCPLLGALPETYRLWKDGGAAVATPTVAINANSRDALAKVAAWLAFIERHPDDLLLIREAADVDSAAASGRLGIVFHFQNSLPIERNLELLRVYHDLGVRMMQLAYNQKNFVGDGCEERTDAGLSKFGVRVIHEMNRLGMIVDLSHAGRRTTLEACETTRAPLVFSHANPRAVHPSPRNIDDEQIHAVVATGGLIGVVGYPAFVAEGTRPRVADLVKHVDYLVETAGVNHVGLGIDYFEMMAGVATDEAATRWYQRALADGQWSPESYPPPPWHYPEEIALPSQLANLVPALLDAGYAEDDMRKIVGGNFLRVFGAVREHARTERLKNEPR